MLNETRVAYSEKGNSTTKISKKEISVFRFTDRCWWRTKTGEEHHQNRTLLRFLVDHWFEVKFSDDERRKELFHKSKIRRLNKQNFRIRQLSFPLSSDRNSANDWCWPKRERLDNRIFYKLFESKFLLLGSKKSRLQRTDSVDPENDSNNDMNY